MHYHQILMGGNINILSAKVWSLSSTRRGVLCLETAAPSNGGMPQGRASNTWEHMTTQAPPLPPQYSFFTPPPASPRPPPFPALLQFVNSYASLFYIAFIEPFTTGCPYDSCLDNLCQSLAIIFCTRLVIANTAEVYLPRFMMKRKLAKVRIYSVRRIKRSRT